MANIDRFYVVGERINKQSMLEWAHETLAGGKAVAIHYHKYSEACVDECEVLHPEVQEETI